MRMRMRNIFSFIIIIISNIIVVIAVVVVIIIIILTIINTIINMFRSCKARVLTVTMATLQPAWGPAGNCPAGPVLH